MPRLAPVALLLVACADPAGVPRPVPAHPFLAANGTSNLHCDAYMTDTYDWAGPADLPRAEVTRATLSGECASVTFDAEGRLITLCISVTGPRELVALDPVTLELRARHALPAGPPSTDNFGGGGYFVLDHQGRAVVPTVDLHLRTVALDAAGTAFSVVDDVDLTDPVLGDALAEDDDVVSVLPDWAGRLWVVTQQGVVGYVDDGHARLVRLDERIGNSFAVDETGGVFVVTEHALYRFNVADDGAVVTTWREAYDRGARLKAGQVNFGSGTTPTLLDDDLVAITDNAEPRVNVLVFDRRAEVDGPRRICEVPVFADGASATDNSLVGFERSFVVENNAGYGELTSVAGAGVTSPGVSRVVVDADGCHVAWTADVAAPSVVPKLSLADRRLYTYEKAADGWYVVALDADGGDEVGRRLVGTEYDANNHWAPITLAPGGALYVGTVFGLTALR